MRDDTRNWIESAEYDLDTAQYLTPGIAEHCLRSTEEAMRWLKEHPNLKE